MADWWQSLLFATTWYEWLALILALAYLVLAAHQKQLCWYAAALSCAIYSVMFWQGRLYMEAILQVIYIVLAGYGWWQWHRLEAETDEPQSLSLSWRWHLAQWAWLIPVAVATVILLRTFTDADQVWLDTFTTVFSLLATWLVAKKVFATWWYWLVIDSVYVYLYIVKGFYATALLFVVYVLLVLYAMWRWYSAPEPLANQVS
ncbi:nicotinamide mononucleotide transporter [Idiomarina tyrosinivorans]|uniref:Nicotinamide riboside transporter PnuC n=1 Tax=Idiomarina tyrosinivorans TaxID=1445662 RepID=A0A432ZQ67_9GAMM|nr:nicotinamide riboside transporter PnuC [Idiomarina tyrosinivorans]RUO80040.1 nicotinamide mononucleotide transporter [Idiomarina tyrosinivorans]